jgi:hypothetical protein
MRITLEIDDDVLEAAKSVAKRDGSTVGEVISTSARRGLAIAGVSPQPTFTIRNGVPVVPSRGEVVTLEKVGTIMDQEGV